MLQCVIPCHTSPSPALPVTQVVGMLGAKVRVLENKTVQPYIPYTDTPLSYMDVKVKLDTEMQNLNSVGNEMQNLNSAGNENAAHQLGHEHGQEVDPHPLGQADIKSDLSDSKLTDIHVDINDDYMALKQEIEDDEQPDELVKFEHVHQDVPIHALVPVLPTSEDTLFGGLWLDELEVAQWWHALD